MGVLDLLLTGFYPAITWMPFVIAGMAPAASTCPPALFSGAWPPSAPPSPWPRTACPLLLAGEGALRSTAGDGPSSAGSTAASLDSGSIEPQGSASELFSGGPRSGTTFDIIGSVGVAVLVIVCATVVMDRLPRLRRLAKPVVAVRTMLPAAGR